MENLKMLENETWKIEKMEQWKTIWYHMVPSGTTWYHNGTIWYHKVPYGTIWYHKVPYGTIWYQMIPYGTIWYHLVPYGTISYHMVPYGFPCFHYSNFLFVPIFPKLSKFPLFTFSLFHAFHFCLSCLLFSHGFLHALLCFSTLFFPAFSR